MIPDKAIEILIIEENQADALELKRSVERMGGYHPALVHDTETAYDIIVRHNPGIIICNLFIANKPTGLELMQKFPDQRGKFIIITSSINESYYEEAKTMGIGGYLVKPFYHLTLRSIIDHILATPILSACPQTPYLFMRVTKNNQLRINFDEILYLYSERNYMFVKTTEKIYTLKRSLVKMQKDLDQRFVRVHNSYIINIDYLKSTGPSTVLIHKDILPLGRAYRKNLTNKIKVIRHAEAPKI